MFPLYSKIQEDSQRLGRAYLRTISLTTLLTMPIFFAMAAAPDVVISGLFGEQWKPAAGSLRIMCLSGSLWAILYIGSALTHARGYVFNEWRRQVVYLAVMIVAMLLLFPFGLEGIALAVGFATLTRYLLLAQLSVKLAGVSWREFFFAQAPGCLLGITVFCSVYITANLGNIFAIADTLKLLMIMGISMLSLILSLFLFPASWFGDLYPWASERFAISLPYWVRLIAAKVLAMRLSVLDETGTTR